MLIWPLILNVWLLPNPTAPTKVERVPNSIVVRPGIEVIVKDKRFNYVNKEAYIQKRENILFHREGKPITPVDLEAAALRNAQYLHKLIETPKQKINNMNLLLPNAIPRILQQPIIQDNDIGFNEVLGINVSEAPAALLKQLDLPYGVVVEITHGIFEKHDILLEWNGSPVKSLTEFRNLKGNMKECLIVRKGKIMKINK